MISRFLFASAVVIACGLAGVPAAGAVDAEASAPIAIAVHGGAGTITRADMEPGREAAIRTALETAVRVGHSVLATGGTSLEAVQAAINILEDSPHFNAGKGAVFNAQGHNELDASIMDGATLNAGAVAAVRRVKNPIDLALKVMTDSKHVMLIGEGAELFAREQGIELVGPSYFHTDFRWEALQRARAEEAAGEVEPGAFYSTVGAVALDRDGNLAAGTSTGGMTNKRYGRVGDSPIIGAGTYAANDGCAVSATGHGEYFIRYVVAYNICIGMILQKPLHEAAGHIINGVLLKAGGSGGVIVMDPQGDIAMPFNTEGMYRASIDADGKLYVGIYADD